MKFNEIKDYNLAAIENIEGNVITLKPFSVVDGSGYDLFNINLSKEEIEMLLDENEDDLILLPYKNKQLLNFER